MTSQPALIGDTENETRFTTISSEDWKRAFDSHKKTPEETTMKHLLALLLLGGAKLTASDDLKFLNAIAAVESGGNDFAIGKKGEMGRFQFTADVWFMHTDLPFSDATKPIAAQVVALKHLRYLRKVLETDSYTIIAYGWLRGPYYSHPANMRKESFEQMKARKSYGERVMAIFNESLGEGRHYDE